MPLSPGDPLDGPDGELVGAPDGGGVTMGRGVSPLVEGAAEAVDVRGVVGPGVDDRAAFEGTVTRAEVPGELTVSLLMVLLMVEAGTAVPCSPELQATAVAGSAATVRRGPPDDSRSSSADAHLLLVRDLLILLLSPTADG